MEDEPAFALSVEQPFDPILNDSQMAEIHEFSNPVLVRLGRLERRVKIHGLQDEEGLA